MKQKNRGFTLAEIIIAMTIVGVIAAITIPALLVSTSEKALEAQKKALLARVSQAMSQIEDLRVYSRTTSGGADDSSALNFINKCLSKVYRINKTCHAKNMSTVCAFPEEITTQDGDTFKISENEKLSTFIGNTTGVTVDLDTEAAGFTTTNGESIAIYYNPMCRGERVDGFYSGKITTALCLNMIYDLNGKDNAPNEVGKDIGFLSVFFPKDPDIALPLGYATDATTGSSFNADKYMGAVNLCKKQNKALIVPTWTEGMSLAVNKKLANMSDDIYLVSGAGKINGAYQINVGNLISDTSDDWSNSYSLRCIYNK